MMRTMALAGLAGWIGTTLVLSQARWFARRPLEERLQPYVPGGWSRPPRRGILAVGSFRDVVRPLATTAGDRLGRVFGLHDDLATRLTRIHSPLDATAVRVRQMSWAAGAFVLGSLVSLALPLPAVAEALTVLGSPLLAFLVIEQEVASASTRWQRRVFHELPVVSEQTGMLLSAGYSLGGALDRISRRGAGACARDLARVGERVRQGLSEAEALREWAELADVPAVTRLVGVLALNRDTGDLGGLISEEARAIRREVQRQLTADLERRAQQVWIPVTVAALLPGTIFIAVPFLQALRLFGA